MEKVKVVGGIGRNLVRLLMLATAAMGIVWIRTLPPTSSGIALGIAAAGMLQELKDLEESGRSPTRLLRWPVYALSLLSVGCFVVAAIRHWRP